MPAPARKKPEPEPDPTPSEKSDTVNRPRGGRPADDFDMDCWEPSLAEKLRKAGRR